MRNTIITKTATALAIFCLVVGSAKANDGFFINPGAGYLIDDENEYFTLSAGYKAGNNSFYAQLFRYDNEELGLDLELSTLTANWDYNIALNDTMSLYLGAGAGLGRIEASLVGFAGPSIEDDVFAANAKAGIEFQVIENLSIRTGLQYFYFGESDFGAGAVVDSVDDVGIEASLKWTF